MDIHFEYDPQFGSPTFPFYDSYPHLVNLADTTFTDNNGELMTRLVMLGENGIDIYQYSLEEDSPEPGDEEGNPTHLDAPEWSILYIVGQCEVYGVLAGRLTIYSTGDMYLIDNILYEGADEITGDFDEEEMESMIGLVSEKNVIIRDNEVNGKNYGAREEDNHDRHSIIVNGSIVALGESFTFEHQNDDTSEYQGPRPDERGMWYQKGGLAQYRRGYFHRSNHQGTGYGKKWGYDSRLLTDAPPGFDPDHYPYTSGRFDRLELRNGHYFFKDVLINTLIVHPGVHITLRNSDALTVRDTLQIINDPGEPIVIDAADNILKAMVFIENGEAPYVEIRNMVIPPQIEFHFQQGEINIENCNIGGEIYTGGSIQFKSNTFCSKVSINTNETFNIENCLFKEVLRIDGRSDSSQINNNTFAGAQCEGIELAGFQSLNLVNNIAAFNGSGIVNRCDRLPVLRYNCVYGNHYNEYYHCDPGIGSISSDPLFVDPDNGDYHLAYGSPCIDAGDPDFPRDPDGSIVEMGAYYYDHNVNVSEITELPEEFEVTAYPNPFNSTLTIKIEGVNSGKTELTVYDILGREVYSRQLNERRFSVDGESLGGSGVYIVKVKNADFSKTIKVLYLP